MTLLLALECWFVAGIVFASVVMAVFAIFPDRCREIFSNLPELSFNGKPVTYELMLTIGTITFALLGPISYVWFALTLAKKK